MQRRPVLARVLHIVIRIAVWLVVFDLAAALLVHNGAKPAMAPYLVAFAAAVIGGLALAGERLGPVGGRSGTAVLVAPAARPEDPATRHLRALTGVTMLVLAATLLGAGLYAERFGGTGKNPDAECGNTNRSWVVVPDYWRVCQG